MNLIFKKIFLNKLNNFLFYSIDKAWSKLTIGGHLVLVINNIRNFPNFIKKLIERQSNYYSKYLGVISYSDEKLSSPQPMWIWEKISDNLNPPLVIKDITHDNKTYHIIVSLLIVLITYPFHHLLILFQQFLPLNQFLFHEFYSINFLLH